MRVKVGRGGKNLTNSVKTTDMSEEKGNKSWRPLSASTLTKSVEP